MVVLFLLVGAAVLAVPLVSGLAGAMPNVISSPWEKFVSPAVRTRETLARAEEGFGDKFESVEERAIYLAETETLVDLIRRSPPQAQRVMVVGHNPGMHELVLVLSDGPRNLREEVAHKFPTAALAEISFDVAEWTEVGPGSGRLRSFLKPRDL